MDSTTRRRVSRELPPNLSELMDTLIKYANSFIKDFDSSEGRMRQIVREFQEIAAKVRKMQGTTDTVRTGGAVAGGVALSAGILFAPFTGGASLLLGGAAAAAVGGGTVVGANITKVWKESGSAEEVEKLGREFRWIVEPMKKKLEEIQTTCKELEEKSSEVQAEKTLRDMKEFNMILTLISELREKAEGVLEILVTAFTSIDGLFRLIVAVFRVTATPEQDEQLRKSIIQSAGQCSKVTDEFDKMNKKLRKLLEQ
ncbi:uncharacterized protein LOC130186764 [Seriola aureovittata]|uniref:uncharacterized protein LOC130186764 n=1 Tax=Seriola aureovittata TaxID=2871759 RepID=UPI0024BD65D3|nr:uncharacterized protein LOC130186764 [Seriola aureovittata]